MRITKPLIEKLMQACINDYNGEYGKRIEVFDKETRFDNENVEGFFGEMITDTKTLYIVFRGTDEKLDWKHNFQFRKLPIVNKITNGTDELETPYKNVSPKIKTHKGFTEDYRKVRQTILDKIATGKYDTIIITGHSLGGSLATLCAVDSQFHFPDMRIINITFASPRVGNKEFAKSYDKRVPLTLRIVNGEDYITKVPLNIQGYYHVGTKIHIGYHNPLCWLPIIRAIGSLYHYPLLYLKNIKKDISEDFDFYYFYYSNTL